MHRLRSFQAWFWSRIETDSILDLVPVYYWPLLIFSLLAITFLPNHIDNPVVGDLRISVWVWVMAVATSAALLGLWLRHGGTSVADMSTMMLRADWLGLCLQAAGHAAMCIMLIEFEVAGAKLLLSDSVHVTSLIWWLLAFGDFAISSYVIGTGLLTLQCFRKIYKALELQASV